MGILGWNPEQFWKASPYDLISALAGWREVNGVRDPNTPSRSDKLLARRLRRNLEAYIEEREVTR